MRLPFVQVTRFKLTLVGNFLNLDPPPLQKLLYPPLGDTTGFTSRVRGATRKTSHSLSRDLLNLNFGLKSSKKITPRNLKTDSKCLQIFEKLSTGSLLD